MIHIIENMNMWCYIGSFFFILFFSYIFSIPSKFWKDWKASRRLKQEVLLKAMEISRKEFKKKRKAKAFYNVALAFNDQHCHRNLHRWMCPTCNKVHDKVKSGWEFMTGLHYPKCCEFQEDHRLFYSTYATTGNYKQEY